MEINIQKAIISQLKQLCPIFNNNVDGAGSLDAFEKNQSKSLKAPAAYVLPLAGNADDNQYNPGFFAHSVMTYGVMVLFSNVGDPSGKKAILPFDDVFWQLQGALTNWNPNPARSVKGFQPKNWSVNDMNGAQLWYLFEFDWEFQITDESVYNIDGLRLDDILVTTEDTASGFEITEDAEISVFNASVSENLNASDNS